MTKFFLVITGGGNKLSYLLGIKKYIEDNNIYIEKYNGSSIGSIIVALMACGISNNKIIDNYYSSKKSNTKMKSLKNFLELVLPQNAHILCSNKISVSTSLKKACSLENKIYNKFESRNDLINILMASSSFPYFINKNIFHSYRNSKYTDGFFTNNTPLVIDNNSFNQIIVKPYLFKPFDVEKFNINKKLDINQINKGYHDMENFFKNGETFLNFTISNNKFNTKLYVYLLLIIIWIQQNINIE